MVTVDGTVAFVESLVERFTTSGLVVLVFRVTVAVVAVPFLIRD
jgi:hypothetical protein